MPSFNIARAGSSFPRVARSEVPVGMIFKNIRSNDELGEYSLIHVGAINGNSISLNINSLNVSTSNNSSRQVALVGKVQYNRSFFAEDEQQMKPINNLVASDMFIMKGRVNADGLPVVFGMLGRDDEGDYHALDFTTPGLIAKFPASRRVTVVGKFGITGTEV